MRRETVASLENLAQPLLPCLGLECHSVGKVFVQSFDGLFCVGFPAATPTRLHIVKDKQLVNDGQRRAPDGVLDADAVFANARGDRQLIGGPR